MKNLLPHLRVMLCLLIIGAVAGCAAGTGAGGTTASAKKAKEKAYDPTGNWDYSVQTPGGESYGIMRISGSNGIFEAVLETDQFGDLVVKNFSVVGTGFTGAIEVMGTVADIEGTFDGEKMSGSVLMGTDSFPLSGARKSK